MAEAVVEEPHPTRYYCHACEYEFLNSTSNFICPRCSKGFVEELHDAESNTSRSMDTSGEDDDLEALADLMFGRNAVNPNRRSENVGAQGPRNTQSIDSSSTTTNLRYTFPLEHLFQDFIINFGVGVNWAGHGNVQLFLGNPGDYAWGREGLDAIVTQLLNQMDSAGPPPVSKAVIDGLQMVEVTPEQVALNLQCSVCWDNFQLKEQVKQLPCQHIYHEKCIRPWLELHGTCPICRKNLDDGERNNENASGSETDFNRETRNVPNVESVLRSLFASTSSNTGPSSGTNTQSGSNNWNRNNDSV